MKKTILFLLCIVLLCSAVLTSCGEIEELLDMADTEDDTEDSSEGEITGPYALEFTSNGDGTCRVTSVKINRSYRELFILEIPEKSPDGETVVAIDWGTAFDSIMSSVPNYIKDGSIFEKMEEKAAGDNMQVFLSKKVVAYYALLDPTNESNQQLKETMLTDCPITQHIPVYRLDKSTSDREFATVKRIFDTFGFTDVEFDQYKAISQALGAKGLTDEQIDGFYDHLPERGNFSTYVSAISFPSTLKSISEGCFDNFVGDYAIISEGFDISLIDGINVESLLYKGETVPEALVGKVVPYSENGNGDNANKTWHYDEKGLPVSW